MNIADKFKENQRDKQQKEEIARQEKVKKLANRITVALSDKETIEGIERYLMEYGSLNIEDFGCLCQGGFCVWQKGLNELLAPLIEEWKVKGVRVMLGLSLKFRVSNTAFPSEMTIEALKEWNKNK